MSDVLWEAEFRRDLAAEVVRVELRLRTTEALTGARPASDLVGWTVPGRARVRRAFLPRGGSMTFGPFAPVIWFPEAVVTRFALVYPDSEYEAVVRGHFFPESDLDVYLKPAVLDRDLNALAALADVLIQRGDRTAGGDVRGEVLAERVTTDQPANRVSDETVMALGLFLGGLHVRPEHVQ